MKIGIAAFCLHERAAEESGALRVIVLTSKDFVLMRQEMKTGVLKMNWQPLVR
jgi:hypothetical protein